MSGFARTRPRTRNSRYERRMRNFFHFLASENLLPFLKGERKDAPHDRFFWRQGGRTALRQGDWKLVNMTRNLEPPKWELYNVTKDLSEANDLADKEPERLDQMKRAWSEWNAQMKEPSFR